jgi:hypothetical protein
VVAVTRVCGGIVDTGGDVRRCEHVPWQAREDLANAERSKTDMSSDANGAEHVHSYPAAPYGQMREGHGRYPDGCEWYAGGACYFDFSDGTVHSPFGDPQIVVQTLMCQSPEDIQRYLIETADPEDQQQPPVIDEAC